MMSGYYLGIDGGGTKTQAVILDDQGLLVGMGTAGASNIGNVGVTQATRNIQEAVELASAEAGITSTSFETAFLGIAGVVSAQDRDTVLKIAHQLRLASEGQIEVDHDCRVALAGGLGGAPGIVQIIGTGTSCFGRTATGDSWMAGGWGYLIADEGGGYWLGVQALKAATEAYDTRGGSTLLQAMVLDALEIQETKQIMQRVYQDQLSVTDIAKLSRLVIDAAQQNDAVAQDIIALGMNEVGRCIESVANHLNYSEDELRLVCIGGILKAGDVIITPLANAVHQRLPTCQIETPQFPPAVGAGILAKQQQNPHISPEFLKNLKLSLQARI